MKRDDAKKSYEERKSRLMAEMVQHIGGHNAISMAALYEIVYGKQWKNMVNDTRKIRELVTSVRNEGVPICSSKRQNNSGYYLAAAGSELMDYTRRSERSALGILARNAKIKKISLPEYMGQLRLEIQ
jgi:hypothetical protein